MPKPADFRSPGFDGDTQCRAVCSRAVEQTKFLLSESERPRHWYDVRSDMPSLPHPVLHSGTGEPVGPDDLAPLARRAGSSRQWARARASSTSTKAGARGEEIERALRAIEGLPAPA
jgi:hypothetical protein